MALNSSFYWPLMLVRGRRHRAMRAIYAFCKVADGIADGPHSQQRKLAGLSSLERRVRVGELSPKLTLTLLRYQIPQHRLLELLQGMRMDAQGESQTVDAAQLERYCYLVAGSVGLMSIKVFGCKDPRSEQFATDLGQILQRINILRDIDEDAARGRNYLPTEWGADAFHKLRDDVQGRINTLQIPYADRWKLLPALAMLGIYEQWFKHIARSGRRRLSAWQKMQGMLAGLAYVLNARPTGAPTQ